MVKCLPWWEKESSLKALTITSTCSSNSSRLALESSMGEPKVSTLAGVVAAAHSEDDAALAEDVGHGEVFGQPQGVPHGGDVEAAAVLEGLGLGGQVEAEHQQVGDALISLGLEVVFRPSRTPGSHWPRGAGRFRGPSRRSRPALRLEYQRSLAGVPSKPRLSSTTCPA